MKFRSLPAAILLLSFVLPGLKAAEPIMKLRPEIREKALTILRGALDLADDPEQFWVAMHAAEGLTLGGYGDELQKPLEPRLKTEKDAQRLCGLARELVRAGHREHVAVMTEVLKRDDSYGHTHAAESLYKVIEVGDEAVMRERFKTGSDLKLRLMAAAALARKLDDAEAYAFIRKSLASDDPDGIQIGSWILSVIGNKDDIEPMRSRLDAAPTPLIRAYVVNGLASLGDPAGMEQLIKNLSDEDPVIRTYAATFAGDAKAMQAQEKLEAMLDDPFADARVRAAQTLLQLSREN